MSSSDLNIARQMAALLGLSQEDNDSDKGIRSSDSTPTDVKKFLEAAASGDRRQCQSFVKGGGDPNVCGSNGITALHVAANKGQPAVINDLLKLGAAVDPTDEDGDTPLILAVLERKQEAVELLIEKGANVRHKNKKGFSAADVALMKRSMTLVLLLEEEAHCLQFNYEVHSTTLESAAQDGSVRIIEYWLKNHPDRRACNYQLGKGRTMAFIAALNGHLDIMQLLDTKRADFELTDDRKHTPLFCAAQNDHFEVVQFLMNKRCNLNHESMTGRTPIFSAVVNGHEGIVELLIGGGANVNHADEDGTSPLECAIRQGSMPIFKLLIKAGANPKHVDDKGYDLAMYAADYQRFDMLKELRKLGASMARVNKKNGETALLGASQVGPAEVVEFLLKEGSDKNHKNKRGVSPVLRAVYNGHADVLKVLADAGADMDNADNDGDSPILVAAQQNNLEFVKLLHGHKCNLAAKNDKGITMAWFAAKNGNLELLKFLKEAGAPMDAPDCNGNTPLMIAVKEAANPDVVSFLVSCGCSLGKKNQKGEKVEDIANRTNVRDIVDALRTKPGKFVQSIRTDSTYSLANTEPEQTAGVLDASFKNWDFMPDDNGSKQCVGKGAFGKVYKVITDKQQFIAVKIVKLSGGKQSDSTQSAIDREKRGVASLSRLRHPNIVEFLKCEESPNGDFCVFTELIAGLSLFDLMQRQKKPFDEEGIRKFARQICSSLNYLHHRNPAILHRDIKCSNIMLTYQGTIKLIDFGLAKEIMTAAVACSSDPCGTLCYMAPELFDGSANTGRVMYTTKSDVWAFGCTVFEMAMMEPPNRNMALALAIKAIMDKPSPKLPSRFSTQLRDFYNCCVTKDMDARPNTDCLLRHEFLANK